MTQNLVKLKQKKIQKNSEKILNFAWIQGREIIDSLEKKRRGENPLKKQVQIAEVFREKKTIEFSRKI